jgi:hypothetical protein
MAVSFVMEFNGIGQDKYDAIMKEMGLDKAEGKWPEGIISHLASKIPTGWLVVDVWESAEHFGRFFEGRLKPAFGKVGGMPEPRLVTGEVYNRYNGKQSNYPSR